MIISPRLKVFFLLTAFSLCWIAGISIAFVVFTDASASGGWILAAVLSVVMASAAMLLYNEYRRAPEDPGYDVTDVAETGFDRSFRHRRTGIFPLAFRRTRGVAPAIAPKKAGSSTAPAKRSAPSRHLPRPTTGSVSVAPTQDSATTAPEDTPPGL